MSWFTDRYTWDWDGTPCQWAIVVQSIVFLVVIFWLYRETKRPPPKA